MTYDVVIIDKETRAVSAVIGTNMKEWDGEGSPRHTVEQRVETGLSRINEHYDCIKVEAGKFKEGDVVP